MKLSILVFSFTQFRRRLLGMAQLLEAPPQRTFDFAFPDSKGLQSPTGGQLHFSEHRELELPVEPPGIPPTRLGIQISSAELDRARYLSDLRTYNGMLGEIFSALHDNLALKRNSGLVRSNIRKFHQRVSDEYSALQRNFENRSLCHLLDYQLHADLISVLERPPGPFESPTDHKVRKLINLATLVTTQLNLALDEKAKSNVNIREIPTYRGLPHSSVVDKLVEINQALLIDTNKHEPQSGFGRVLERDELNRLLAADGARLFLLELRGNIVGYYILHTTLNSVEPLVARALEDPRLALHSFRKCCGWAAIVGILPQARKDIESHSPGLRAYDLIDTAVEQSAKAHNLDGLFGEVREGPQGNLAKRSHVRCKWRETGVTYSGGQFPYQILERTL